MRFCRRRAFGVLSARTIWATKLGIGGKLGVRGKAPAQIRVYLVLTFEEFLRSLYTSH